MSSGTDLFPGLLYFRTYQPAFLAQRLVGPSTCFSLKYILTPWVDALATITVIARHLRYLVSTNPSTPTGSPSAQSGISHIKSAMR